MISDVEVSLSHLSRSVIHDLAGLGLSEGDSASQFVLSSPCQLRGSFFSLHDGSTRDSAIFLPVLFLYIFFFCSNRILRCSMGIFPLMSKIKLERQFQKIVL